MPERWGPGPVFVYESIVNARRWQVFAARSGFVLLLLIGMIVVWSIYATGSQGNTTAPASTFQALSRLGENFFYALASIQLPLVLLAAPAATAGAICMDRARGTLLHMLVTDLSDNEIVLGKLAARLAPVFALIACAVPVMALGALLGGVDFGSLAGLFVSSLALAVFGCALALAFSVWTSKTHEVLIAVYMIEGLWLISLPIWWGFATELSLRKPPEWFEKLNPFVLVFAPYARPGFTGTVDVAIFAGAMLVLAIGLVTISIRNLRRVAVEQSGKTETRPRKRRPKWKTLLRRLPGPTLDGNPVLWREWYHNRPSHVAGRIWRLLLLGTWILAIFGTYEMFDPGPRTDFLLLMTAFMLQLFFGLLILSATAPTALSEERTRGSLDVLLTTPMSTPSIVLAKWWGVFRYVLLLVPMAAYTSFGVAMLSPPLPAYIVTTKTNMPTYPLTLSDRYFAAILSPADFLATGAAITSLGILLAIWIPRLGRAVTVSVILFVANTVGWLIIPEFIAYKLLYNQYSLWISHNHWLVFALNAMSPYFGPVSPLQVLNFGYEKRGWYWLSLCFTTMIKAFFALFLLALAIRTFDRRMERMPETNGLSRAD